MSSGPGGNLKAHVFARVSIATAVVVASGCGGQGSQTSQTKSSGSDPLTEFFGGGSPAEQQALANTQMRQSQEKIAACMRKQGFNYVTFTPAVGPIGAQAKTGEEVAWKRKHGYGMADGFVQSQRAQPQKDPNQAIREKLSRAEQTSYDKALSGFDTAHPPQNGATVQPSGCMADAYGLGAETQAASQQLGSKFQALEVRVNADRRVSVLNQKWATCMKQHGYNAAKERDIYEKVLWPRQQKLFESMSNTVSSAAPAQGAPFEIPTIPAAKLEEFRRFELTVANADADCRPQKDANTIRTIREEYERSFVNDNRALLTKLKQAQQR